MFSFRYLQTSTETRQVFGPPIASDCRVMGDEHIYDAVKTSVPGVEEVDIVLIDEKTLREAQQWISGCEACSEDAPLTFDYLLDAVTGCCPTVTEYMMCRPAQCPVCSALITEKTMVLVA